MSSRMEVPWETRDPYIAQEMASDRFTGRSLAGLLINLTELAASYPNFICTDAVQSVQEGGVRGRGRTIEY